MITEQERRRRRVTYRFVQLALVVVSLGIVVAFFSSRRSERRAPETRLTSDVPTVTDLGAGDARLFNVDTTVELILRGDKILAGLSPRMVEQIRAKIQTSGKNTKSGSIGDLIATTVKEQVADKIAIHAEYDVREIESIYIENHQIVIQWKGGKEQPLFGSIKTDGDKANRFDVAEAERFIELVRERQKQLR